MVWRSKGAVLLQMIDAMQLTGDGMDACDGERFLAAQGRQQSRQLMGQAGLVAAGGTHFPLGRGRTTQKSQQKFPSPNYIHIAA